MRQRKHNVGDVVGNRLIIEYPYKSKKILVRCTECESESWIYISNLTSGASKRCWECRKMNPEVSTFKMCQRTAKRRGIEWSLDFDTWLAMATQRCYYCDAEPSNSSYGFEYNGIDRVDSSDVYKIENVVTCCVICNRAKSNMMQEEFYNWIRRVHGRL